MSELLQKVSARFENWKVMQTLRMVLRRSGNEALQFDEDVLKGFVAGYDVSNTEYKRLRALIKLLLGAINCRAGARNYALARDYREALRASAHLAGRIISIFIRSWKLSSNARRAFRAYWRYLREG